MVVTHCQALFEVNLIKQCKKNKKSQEILTFLTAKNWWNFFGHKSQDFMTFLKKVVIQLRAGPRPYLRSIISQKDIF